MEKNMILKILLRNALLFLIAAALLSKSVDRQECFIKRGKYLLGIVYNGFFQNERDKIVYEDYLKRHGSSPEIFQKGL